MINRVKFPSKLSQRIFGVVISAHLRKLTDDHRHHCDFIDADLFRWRGISSGSFCYWRGCRATLPRPT